MADTSAALAMPPPPACGLDAFSGEGCHEMGLLFMLDQLHFQQKVYRTHVDDQDKCLTHDLSDGCFFFIVQSWLWIL